MFRRLAEKFSRKKPTPYVVTKFQSESTGSVNSISSKDAGTPEVKEQQSPTSIKYELSAGKKELIKQIVRFINDEIRRNAHRTIDPNASKTIFRPRDSQGRLLTSQKYLSTQFVLKEIHPINIEGYLTHILQHSRNVSEDSLIGMVINLNRFFANQPFDWLHSYNVHRLLLTSLVVAQYHIDLDSYENEYFAPILAVGEGQLKLLNELEKIFSVAVKNDFDYPKTDLINMKGLLANHHIMQRPPRLASFRLYDRSKIDAASVSLPSLPGSVVEDECHSSPARSASLS